MQQRVVPRLRRFFETPLARRLALGLALLTVWAIYWFIGSAGRKGPWPRYMDYYDLLAEAFRDGHLYVSVEPSAKLLKKANPYDPSHVKLWFWDVSLYQGRYYMYWGPVPGALQALAKSVLRINRMIGDQYLVFAMYSLNALGGTLLIERLQRRVFTSVPLWLVLLGVLTFGLANPGPHLVASGGVYQASIASAQAFLVLGTVFAFDAVWEARKRGATTVPLVLAGFFWALTLGSRLSMAPCVLLLVASTALASHRPQRWLSWEPWKGPFRAALVVAIPLAMGVGALMIYNKLRFDSFLESGITLQLTTLKFKVSTDYWLANLYTHLARPYQTECAFPYFFATWYPSAKVALPAWMGVPDGYMINEPVVGWLRVVTVTWWLPIAVVVAYRKVRRLLASRSSEADASASETEDARSPTNVAYIYCAITFALLGTLTGLVLMGMYMATMRYLADVTNGLVLLGIMGAFTFLASRVTRRGRSLVTLAIVASFGSTMFFGLLLGYQGYNGHFKQFNPSLDERLQDRFSTCDHPKQRGSSPSSALAPSPGLDSPLVASNVGPGLRSKGDQSDNLSRL